MLNEKERKALENMLRDSEGVIDYLYQDSLGKVTIGIGNLIKNIDDMTRIDLLTHEGIKASEQQKREAYTRVYNAPGYRSDGRPLAAPYYKKYSKPRMTCAEIKKQLSTSVLKFYNEIKIIFPCFDTFPHEAKLACMDMLFNLGMTALNSKWPRFKSAVKKRNWQEAAVQSYRYQLSKRRNSDIRLLFLKAHEIESKPIKIQDAG